VRTCMTLGYVKGDQDSGLPVRMAELVSLNLGGAFGTSLLCFSSLTRICGGLKGTL